MSSLAKGFLASEKIKRTKTVGIKKKAQTGMNPGPSVSEWQSAHTPSHSAMAMHGLGDLIREKQSLLLLD